MFSKLNEEFTIGSSKLLASQFSSPIAQRDRNSCLKFPQKYGPKYQNIPIDYTDRKAEIELEHETSFARKN